jgi:hypothetical protein
MIKDLYFLFDLWWFSTSHVCSQIDHHPYKDVKKWLSSLERFSQIGLSTRYEVQNFYHSFIFFGYTSEKKILKSYNFYLFFPLCTISKITWFGEFFFFEFFFFGEILPVRKKEKGQPKTASHQSGSQDWDTYNIKVEP